MKTVSFALLVAVEQRAGNRLRQRGGKKKRTAVQRRQHVALKLGVEVAAGVHLLVIFDLSALVAGRHAPVNPFRLLKLSGKIVHFLRGENGGNMVHHRFIS